MRVTALMLGVLAVVSACRAAPARDNALPAPDEEKPATTHALLSALGMRRLHVPPAHHRKRLADQGRRHASGDSRMFVIKLPPSNSYYAHSAPAPPSGRTLPLPLTSNGKPAKVYHWNIPMLQRMASESGRPQARLDDETNVASTPTWPKIPNDHPNSLDALSYYVPTKPKKSSFRKYFSGNGKPKSFYIMEKSMKATQYHRLLP